MVLYTARYIGPSLSTGNIVPKPQCFDSRNFSYSFAPKASLAKSFRYLAMSILDGAKVIEALACLRTE
jgi:hypothetical protein